MSWYWQAIRNMFQFNGRAGRTEYWFFTLFNAFFVTGAIILDILLKTDFTIEGHSLNMGWISTIYSLLVLIPSLSLTVRRLHDSNKNGWYFLIPILAMVIFYLCLLVAIKNTRWHGVSAFFNWFTAGIVLLFIGMISFTLFLLIKGTNGPNRYGEIPALRNDRITKKSREILLLLLIIVSFAANAASNIWVSMAKQADKNGGYSQLHKMQETFISVSQALGHLLVFTLMGLPFLLTNKKMRIAAFILTGGITLMHLYYTYGLYTKALFGE
ncbi:MAG TPA: DUF805 domain-containing protein [Niabella sp.]